MNIRLGVSREAGEYGDDLRQCRVDHRQHPVVRPASKERRRSNRSLLGSSIPSSLASVREPQPESQLTAMIR